MKPMQIQLTVEEALAFKELEAKLSGFIAGCQAMSEHIKRMRIEEILASRGDVSRDTSDAVVSADAPDAS